MEKKTDLPQRLTAQQSKVWLLYCHLPLSFNILREVCVYLGNRLLLPCLQESQLKLYDLETLQWKCVSLSRSVTTGWTYCLLEDRELLCINSLESQTYELALETGVFVPTGRLPRPLEFPGMIWIESYAYSFGGYKSRLALKYAVREKHWEKMADLHYEKCAFTPCLYRKEVYLCCFTLNGDPFEAFSPETETTRQLPTGYSNCFHGSVTFALKDTFYIVGYGCKLVKYRPNDTVLSSEETIDLKREPYNALTNIPPVQVGKSIYWVNHSTSRVVRFDVDSCSIVVDFQVG